MNVKVYTSPRSWYWAEFVDVFDSEFLLVRCFAKQQIHKVRKEMVHQ